MEIFDLDYWILNVRNNDKAIVALKRRKLHPFSPMYVLDQEDKPLRLQHLCKGYVFIPAVPLLVSDLDYMDGVYGFATTSGSKSFKAQVLDNRLKLPAKLVKQLAVSSLQAALRVFELVEEPIPEPKKQIIFNPGDQVELQGGYFKGHKAVVHRVDHKNVTVFVAHMAIIVPNELLAHIPLDKSETIEAKAHNLDMNSAF